MRFLLSPALLILACWLPEALAEEPARREVQVEVRLVEVPASLAAKLQLPAGNLNDRQVQGLMARVQGDRRSNVLAMPRIRAEDGQSARIAVGAAEEAEFALDVCPRVGKKGNEVGLTLHVEHKDAPAPVDRLVQVGDGQTAVLRGWQRPGPKTDAVPLLGKLPVVGALFQNQEEPRTTFVLATARVMP